MNLKKKTQTGIIKKVLKSYAIIKIDDVEKKIPYKKIKEYEDINKNIINLIIEYLSLYKTVNNTNTEMTKYNRTNTLVSELTQEELSNQKKEEEFKCVFIKFLDNCHNTLRSNQSVMGTDALDDIIYTFLIVYLSKKVTWDEGVYNFGNTSKAYYKNPAEKKKVTEYLPYLNVDYLLDHVDELLIPDKLDAIKKIAYILSKHPSTKNIIKNENFINSKNANSYAKLLKEISDFSNKYDIFKYTDIIGRAYEYFVNGRGSGDDDTQHFTERPLMNMSFKLIDKEDIIELGIDNNSTIGDEFCGTIGYPINLKKYLKDTYDININDKNIYGVEQHDRLSRYAKINAMLSLTNSNNVTQGDSFVTNVTPHLDIGIYNVPFGKKSNYDEKEELYNSSDELPEFKSVCKCKGPLAVTSSQLAFYKVKKMGLCIIKDGVETSSPSMKTYRKFLCDNYVIKKIMKIPQGTFSSTGTATVCIYFIKKEGKSTENIQFLQLNQECSQLHEICKINLNDLKQNNYSWDPNAYLVDEKMKELMEKSKCEIKMLKDVSEIIYGNRNKENISDTETYPCLGGGEKVSKYTNKWNIPKGTIIIARSGSCGSISIFDVPCLLGSYAFFLKFKENINKISIKYIYYYLKNVEAEIKKLGKGGNQKNINRDELYNFPIHFPKIEIQTKCVEQLNDLSNQKEMINSMKDGIKRQMKYFIDSQIQKSVNDNNVEVKMLKDVYEIIYGNRNKENISDTETYPCLGGGKKVSKYTNKWNIPKDTIIIARSGSCGSISIFDVPCLLGSYAFFLKMNSNVDNVNNMYMYYYLKNIEDEIKKLGKGGNQKNINRDELYKFPIQIPKLEIQESITQKMNELSDKIKNIDNDIVFIDNLMKDIMQSTYQ